MSEVLSISNNIIVMNRGDSYSFDVDLLDENNQLYRLKDEDTVYFGVMLPHQQFEVALIKKKFTVEDYVDGINGESTVVSFEIAPKDTIELATGKYYYAIKLRLNHIDNEGNEVTGVKTIINKTKFILCD